MPDTTSSQLIWIGDNLASFSLHLAVVLAIIAVALTITGSRRTGALALIASVPFGVLVAQAAINGTAVGRCPQELQRFTAISVNLLDSNQNYRGAIDYISTERPDIVAFQETVHGWPSALHRLYKIYPYRAQSPDGATRLYSRHKFASLPFAEVVPSIHRSVGADIDINGNVVRVISAHFIKPVTAAMHRHRQSQMAQISNFIAQSRKPAIVMGDFNAGPTSFNFLNLIKASRLNTPSLQMPPVTTWPAKLPGLGIQIDHILATGDFRFERIQAGPDIGSNHLPVEAELAIDPDGMCQG